MSKHSEIAEAYFKQGYNCSQSVFLAFCDETGMDEETAMKLASSFGGGMGRLREVCGAVSGMFMVIGLLYGYTDAADKSKMFAHYARIQDLAEQFKTANGSIVCRELLGLTNKKEETAAGTSASDQFKRRPCVEYVISAAEILDRTLDALRQDLPEAH